MFVNNKGKPYASLDTNRYWKFRLTGEYGLKASDNTINIFLRVLYIRNKTSLGQNRVIFQQILTTNYN